MFLRSIAFAVVLALVDLSSATAQGPPPKQFDMALKVVVHPAATKKGGATLQAHQKVADQLTAMRIGVPDDRINYFQNRRAPKNVPFIGWTGMIESINPAPNGGVIVLLTVHSKYSGGYHSTELYERYLVAGGKAKYLGCALTPSVNYPYVEFN